MLVVAVTGLFLSPLDFLGWIRWSKWLLIGLGLLLVAVAFRRFEDAGPVPRSASILAIAAGVVAAVLAPISIMLFGWAISGGTAPDWFVLAVKAVPITALISAAICIATLIFLLSRPSAKPSLPVEAAAESNSPMPASQAIKTGLSRSFKYDGRASRSEFWWTCLFCFVALTVVMWIASALSLFRFGGVLTGLALLLVTFAPVFAALVRRAHDVGASGALVVPVFLLFLIGPNLSFIFPVALVVAPILAVAAGIWLLLVASSPSKPGPNKYGPNPHEVTP